MVLRPAGTPCSLSTLAKVSCSPATSSTRRCSFPSSRGICARSSATMSACTRASLARLIRSLSFLRVELRVREWRSANRSASSALGRKGN